MQNISNRGLNMIKNSEGFRADAYNATGYEPYLTIGYGHYGPDVYPGQFVTEAQASQMLLDDMASYIQAVRNYTQGKTNQNQFDALVSFCYNLGVGIFAGWGSFDADYVRRNLPLYNKGYGENGTLVILEGLNNRRKAELALFNDGTIIDVPDSNGETKLKKGEEMHILVRTVDTKNPKTGKVEPAMWEVMNGYYTHIPNPAVLTNLKKANPGIMVLDLIEGELKQMYKSLK